MLKCIKCMLVGWLVGWFVANRISRKVMGEIFGRVRPWNDWILMAICILFQWRIQNFIMGAGADGRGAEGDASAPRPRQTVPSPEKKLNFYLKQVGFGAFYRITFYVQKGIRKGIQDQQGRFCITDTSMQKVKFVRASQSIFADNFCPSIGTVSAWIWLCYHHRLKSSVYLCKNWSGQWGRPLPRPLESATVLI